MAATIDDLIPQIENLVNVLQVNQNSNNNGTHSGTTNGSTFNPRRVVSFSNFSDDLERSLRNTVTSIVEIANGIKREKAVLKDAEKKINHLDKLKETSEYKNLSPEQQKQADVEINLSKSNIQLAVAKHNLSKEERKYQSDIVDAEKKYAESQAKYVEKIQKQHAREIDARSAREEWEAKGFRKKNGKKNSGAELFSAIGNFTAKFKTETVGRLIGESLAKAGGIAKSGLNIIDSGKMDVTSLAGSVSGGLSKLGPYGQAAGAAVDIFAKLFEMYSKVNTEASKYARTVGGGASAMYKMQTQMAEYAKNLSKMGERAYDASELIKSLAEYSTEAGRNFEYLGEKGVESLYNLQQFGVDNKMISQFDTFGISVTTVSDRIASLYNNSGKRGLNAKAVQEKMLGNLKMAQNYTFANGVKALERMAQRSTELKMNMENAVRFADKVGTLEGSLGAGAQLSVLGGNMSMMGNPLSMLYSSLNDVEGLMNMSLEMTKGMADFDAEKGQIDISAFNRQRLKAMADATGIDYSELTNQTMNQARENMVMSQMGGGLNEDTQQYIKNIAQIDKNGKAYVTLNGERKNVSALSDDDKEQLRKESEAKDNAATKGVGDIFNETRGIQEKLDDLVKTVKTKIVNFLMKIAGFSSKDKALMQGLSSKNADYFLTLNSDQNSEFAKQRLFEMGASEEDMKKYEMMSKDAKETFILNTVGNFAGNNNGFEYHKEMVDDGGHSLHSASIYSNFAKENNRGETKTLGQYKKEQEDKYNTKVARGGYISGPGSSTSDSIPAMLSNGEFVVNAKATNNNRALLEQINAYRDGGIVKPSKEQWSGVKVSSTEVTNNNNNAEKVSIEPLKIDLSGTLKLDAGGFTKDIPADKLLTPEIVDQIIKSIQKRMDFGLNRDKLNQKFG